jgi:hypothetical protein
MMLNSQDLHVSAAKAPINFRKRATVALVTTLLLVLCAIAITGTPSRKLRKQEGREVLFRRGLQSKSGEDPFGCGLKPCSGGI